MSTSSTPMMITPSHTNTNTTNTNSSINTIHNHTNTSLSSAASLSAAASLSTTAITPSQLLAGPFSPPFLARTSRSMSESWSDHRSRKQLEAHGKRYIVLGAAVQFGMGLRLNESYPDRFHFLPIDYSKFPDGTDNITISGFAPENVIAGEHVLFLASFHNNDVTLSQFSVLIVLLQSFIQSLTIVLPFYPVGTNERVEMEGKVATANTYALLLSNLPSIGCPTRIMIYDIHALQERFYFHNSAIPSLHSALPLLLNKITSFPFKCKVAFPDDGAAKRFGSYFKAAGLEVIVCGKVRDGDKRRIHIANDRREIEGSRVVIVDDLVQTGGTLFECARALKDLGADSVYAYVTHAVFPNDCWKDFLVNSEPPGKRAIFEKFWITNSQPSVTCRLPEEDCFEILDLLPLIVSHLDAY